METRYIGNMSALTEAECMILRTKTVFVAGCGGASGTVIEMLLRLGVKEIRCADGNRFDEDNLHDQLLCDLGMIGWPKPDSAFARAVAVNTDVVFTPSSVKLTEANAERLIKGCDIVIDGCEDNNSRAAVKAACDKLDIPFVFGCAHGWEATAALLTGSDTLPETDGTGNAPYFTTAMCGALQSALCVKYLCGREIEKGIISFRL